MELNGYIVDVLCFKEESDGNLEYFFIQYQFLEDSMLSVQRFKDKAMKNPKIKIQEKINEEFEDEVHDHQLKVFIFNKQLHGQEYQKEHLVYEFSTKVAQNLKEK